MLLAVLLELLLQVVEYAWHLLHVMAPAAGCQFLYVMALPVDCLPAGYLAGGQEHGGGANLSEASLEAGRRSGY